MFSRDVGAVEHQRVGAGLALDDVAAVARVPDERVVAVAEQGRVVALVAVDGVVAVAAEQRSAPGLPMMVSLPPPPSMARPMTAGREALIVSLPLPPLTVRRSPASGWSMLTCAGSPVTATPVAVATTLI